MTRFGLIGMIRAHPGKGDALAEVLLDAADRMRDSVQGCESYVIARAPDDPDAIWVTEVWESREAHAASLTLDSVKAAIERGRPLIAGFSERVETIPVGGLGLG
ncbi:MAG TPA: antibiotic biosynthesis monooxygenase family protein [Thermoleophilaceae bacterium]|jgi:quinol monooxygenase YgiN|nr:antibiotic biosynthesis monooxygenase family protein [Thermoleophilaceae bacterium]